MEECIEENFLILHQYNLPILNELSNLTDDAKKSLFGEALIKFYKDILTDSAIQSTIESAKKWKANKLEEIDKEKISGSDILIIYSVRKQVFLNHLALYTDNCSEIIKVMKEVETFFLHLEQVAINTYVDIQKEIIVEEKEFSESILNNTIDGIIVWDKDFRVTAWNTVLEKHFDLLRNDIIGKNYFDLFPAYRDSKEAIAMEKVLLGERQYFPDNQYLHKEGSYEMNLIPLKDAHGKVSGGLSIVHDITEQKNSEKLILDQKEELQCANEELQEQQQELSKTNRDIREKKKNLEEINATLEKEISNRRIIEEELKKEKIFVQAILNNMREGIVACDEKGQLSYFNEATKNFHGLHLKRLDYKDWPSYFNLYLPDGKSLLDPEETPLYKAFKGEEVKDIEMVIARTNGEKINLSVNGQAIFDEEGKKLGAVVVMHDITIRKQTEKELKKSLEFYLTILQDFPALIWRADTTGNFDYFNNTWLEFTGRTLDQEAGYGWAEGVYPEDLDRCVDTYDAAFKAREPFSMQYRLKHKNGQYRWLIDFGKPLYDLNNKFLGFLGVCYDIQELKEKEKEISEKNDKLISTLEKLRTAEYHLKKLNNELELRVQRRTDELSASEEELKQTLDQTIQLNEIITQRERFLSSIIDQTPISTCIFDSLGNQIRVNKACMKLFGATDEKQGIGKYNILKDEVLIKSPYFKNIEEVFSKGKVAKFTIDYNLSDVSHVSIPTGIPVTVITTIFPIKNSANKVINAIVQHEDITERKAAEEALKSSEEQLRLITDALPVLIAYVDKNQKYRFNNKAYEDWFKVRRDKIYGKTVKEVIGETAYERLKEQINKALNGKEIYYEASLPYKDAGQKYVAINYIPHFYKNEVAGYYTLINDISKQKEIQRALELALQDTNDKNEELQKINNDLDNFIYIASHDLKSPIVNLEGLISALNKKIRIKTNDSEHKILEMIGQSIDKFKNTLKNLTEVTKAQRNLEEEKELLDFHELVQEVKEEIQPMIIESKALIKEELEVREILFVPMNLRSIVYNLLTNAIKYRNPAVPLKISIKSYREGSNIVLAVKDNGLGLSNSQQSKLFTMFKRMHSHVEGTGIGLYILKRIAENSGGKVVVESAVNVGTEFKVYFRDN